MLQHDAATPAAVRAAALQWGLCADEFPASGGWPPQLYVREARRLVGERVFTGLQVNAGVAPLGDSVGEAPRDRVGLSRESRFEASTKRPSARRIVQRLVLEVTL